MEKRYIVGMGKVPDDGLWLRTRSSVPLLDNGHQRPLQAGHDLPATRVESFLADSRGDLWIGTNKGLFSLGKGDGHPQLQPAIGFSTVLSLFEDKEGNLWVGTETAGLHILRQQNFHTLPALGDHVVTPINPTTDDVKCAGNNRDILHPPP